MAERGSDNTVRPDNAPAGVGAAARAALRDLLKPIPKLVGRASDSDAVRAEDVHRMRVSTRRGAAALQAFAPLIADEAALGEMEQQLKAIRKSGARTRCCDVDLAALSARLDRCEDADEVAAIGFAMRRLADERDRGARGVRRFGDRFSRKSFRRLVKRLIRSIPDDADGPTPTDWAMRSLSAAFEEVWSLGRSDDATAEELHELRLALKRLRYQAELFEPIVVWSGWRGVIEAAIECQDRLGHANDATELAARVGAIARGLERGADGWSGRVRAGLERLASGLESEGASAGGQARDWWAREGRRSIDRLVGTGSTRGRNGPMMDLDAAMDAAIRDARESLTQRGGRG